ncbi:MAG TPA: plastocyanin/azurin family copper-binding protein [Gemmatimonadaceae bacterium]
MKNSLRIAAFLAATLLTSALPLRGDHGAATIVVRMIGDEKGYRFVPASITAHVGDVVRFVNVSGGPHNVAFREDGIPAGAEAALQKNMGQTIGPLSGALIIEPNESYTVSLAGLRAGTYKYYCVPHQAMNMSGRIRVRAR